MFAFSPIAKRFVGGAPEFRFEAWPVVWREALAHLPWGAGVGAFDRVFRAAEPLALVAPTFFNHAHNDYLEALLEAGWPPVASFLAFLAWFASGGVARLVAGGLELARARQRLRSSPCSPCPPSIIPLRTPALMCLFAVLLRPAWSRRRDRAPHDHAPEISCVVPAFESAGLVRACLASILAQRGGGLEVIVSDDSRSAVGGQGRVVGENRRPADRRRAHGQSGGQLEPWLGAARAPIRRSGPSGRKAARPALSSRAVDAFADARV